MIYLDSPAAGATWVVEPFEKSAATRSPLHLGAIILAVGLAAFHRFSGSKARPIP